MHSLVVPRLVAQSFYRQIVACMVKLREIDLQIHRYFSPHVIIVELITFSHIMATFLFLFLDLDREVRV